MKTFKDNFDEIYLEYFVPLCRFAFEYLGDFDEAKNLVQDVFMDIWLRRDSIKVRGSLSTYLCSMVKNKCIDRLRHLIAVYRHRRELSAELSLMESGMEALEHLDVSLADEAHSREGKAVGALASLPPKCREIFLMSKLQGKKYKEIAELLGISQNTVESQISIALRKLKEYFKQ